jgi:hypothetical protein
MAPTKGSPMSYRNDHDAALSRIAALEQELREARRENERMRRETSGATQPVEVRLPPIPRPRVRHVYDGRWNSAGVEAEQMLSAALRDAEEYRRENPVEETTPRKYMPGIVLRPTTDETTPSSSGVMLWTVLAAVLIGVVAMIGST